MKADTLKKIVLGILTLVVMYVWYGNVQLFRSSASYSSATTKTSETQRLSVGASHGAEPPFQRPKVNPFLKSEPSQKKLPSLSAKKNSRQNSSTPPPTPPSTLYRLLGTLAESNAGFVALTDRQGKQVLLQQGDTLAGWTAKRIRPDRVIFVQGKYRDTLQLKTIDLQ